MGRSGRSRRWNEKRMVKHAGSEGTSSAVTGWKLNWMVLLFVLVIMLTCKSLVNSFELYDIAPLNMNPRF